MQPTEEFIEELDEEKIRQAKAMTEEQRFLAVLDLFDMTAEMTRAGIRMDHPDADERQVLEIFRQRLSAARREEGTE